MRLDHVVFAATDLSTLTDAADRVGLSAVYGGVHPDANTENAVVSLADGSYVELLGSTGGEPGWWTSEVTGGAGPTDWCLRVPDVAETLQRSIAAGLGVHGPVAGNRERPDGTQLEWDLGWHLDPGQPFCITDRTPREWRVPAAGVDAPTRVASVVLAGLSEADERALRRRYRLATPTEHESDLAATVRTVPGTPLAFADPDPESDLAERVERFGPGPCTFVLACTGLDRYSLTEPEPWGTGTVQWFDDQGFHGRLGVVEEWSDDGSDEGEQPETHGHGEDE